MLDLPAFHTPPHWLLAPLPDAPLCQPRADRLALSGRPEFLVASPALLAALAAPAAPGVTLAACDSSGAVWRLRRADAAQPLWQAQALEESRVRLFNALRGLLGPRLSGSLLHELRSPLNALSLHAELIERTLSGRDPAAAAPRVLDSAAVIRERLRDLGQRQDALVDLWFGAAGGAGAALSAVVERSLRLLRGHLSLQGIRLRGSGLEALGAARLARGAAEAQLVLITLLLAACEGAQHNRVGAGEAEILLAVDNDGAGLVLEVQAPCEAAALGRELAGTGADGLLAALALLLEPAGLRLEAPPGQALSRLILPAG